MSSCITERTYVSTSSEHLAINISSLEAYLYGGRLTSMSPLEVIVVATADIHVGSSSMAMSIW